jgi:hypothetical protein
MPPTKRQKRSHETHIESHETESDNWGTLSASEMSDSVKGRQSPDTEDEIAEGRLAKSKKTLKRKHRATDPSNFGASLQSLLKTDAPSGLPLSLKPSAARRRNDEKLELKAKKLLKGERKNKEEVGRIRDVIGDWGVESERTLRKVAQRGGEKWPPHPPVGSFKIKSQSRQTVQCDTTVTGKCRCCRKRNEKCPRVWQANATCSVLGQKIKSGEGKEQGQPVGSRQST